METVVLGIFAAALLICVGLGRSILYALVFGLFLFWGYGLSQGHRLRALLGMSLDGVRTVRNILMTFVLIGVITAFWRAGGTIPFIVSYAAQLCTPSAIVLLSFLLCCMVSVLTGTAFGSAATVGVICMTMAGSMGVSPVYTGGAVLAGVYFGDRCSPMSTSALLVSELTGTDIFRNISSMIRTSVVPFLGACAVYGLLGAAAHTGQADTGVQQLFQDSFVLHPVVLIPAVIILALSALRIPVKITMSCSIAAGGVICLFVQRCTVPELLRLAVFGFHPDSAPLAALLEGGGVLSMAKVFAIVCLSSCYAGIFRGTGLLDSVQGTLRRLSRKITPFGSLLCTSILTSMVACNQTLAIMLTDQLCQGVEPQTEKLAIGLENTVVVIAALAPWSIACAVPLESAGAPAAAVLAACYLYLLPLWNFGLALFQRKTAA